MAVDIWSSGWQVRKKILQLVKAYAYVEKCKNRHTWHTHETLIFLSFGNSALTEKRQSEAKKKKKRRTWQELLMSTMPKV